MGCIAPPENARRDFRGDACPSRVRARTKAAIWKTAAVFLLTALMAIVLYPAWKPLAKRSKWFVIATDVGLDSLRRYGLSETQIGQPEHLSIPDAGMAKILQDNRLIYNRYLRFAHWSPADVAGKRMIELGPGYTIGVPLLFAADGADRVVGIDKFVPLQEGADFRKLYSRMREELSREQQRHFDRAIGLEPDLRLNPQVVTYIDHKELPDSVQQLGAGTYDIIVSNAVMEEIYDPLPTFLAQDQALRPGGLMVHVIDLRDYGMFSKYGFHPLEFLTIPDWIYRRMVASSGQPNRLLVNSYRDLAAKLGYSSEIYITRVLGQDAELPQPKLALASGDISPEAAQMLHQIRPQLLSRYRTLSDSDLLTQSIVFVGHKPLQGHS